MRKLPIARDSMTKKSMTKSSNSSIHPDTCINTVVVVMPLKLSFSHVKLLLCSLSWDSCSSGVHIVDVADEVGGDGDEHDRGGDDDSDVVRDDEIVEDRRFGVWMTVEQAACNILSIELGRAENSRAEYSLSVFFMDRCVKNMNPGKSAMMPGKKERK